MAQTTLVVQALRATQPELRVEVVPMRTRADADPRPFAEIGPRGIFATELERALLAGEIDAAVHSCKDLALEEQVTLELAAYLPREDPRDVVCGPAASLDQIPEGASVATSSSRRAAALRRLRPDLVASPIRGNVQTRLERSAARGDAGCMLAAAGLRRLGLDARIGFAIEVDACVPEAGQGAVVVQVRAGEGRGGAVAWELIDDASTAVAVRVERRVAAALGGGCDTPVGVHVDLARALGAVFVPAPSGASPSAAQLVTCQLRGDMTASGADEGALEDALLRLAGRDVGANCGSVR